MAATYLEGVRERATKKATLWVIVMAWLGLLYGLNELLLQPHLIGPDWLRWHLSSFGCVFYLAAVIKIFSGWEPRRAVMAGSLISVGAEFLQFSNDGGDPIDLAVTMIAMLVAYLITKWLEKLHG